MLASSWAQPQARGRCLLETLGCPAAAAGASVRTGRVEVHAGGCTTARRCGESAVASAVQIPSSTNQSQQSAFRTTITSGNAPLQSRACRA